MTLPPVAPEAPPEEPEAQQPGWKRYLPAILAAALVAMLLAVVGIVALQNRPPSSAVPLSTRDEPYQDTLQRTIDDMDTFWAQELPEHYGVEYVPLRHGTIRYTSTQPPPNCGTQQLTYEEMAFNAYYCPPQPRPEDRREIASGDYIAYDDEALFPEISDTYGGAGVAAIMAHEWGHAIQTRAGVTAKNIELELQADCFSGAWFGYLVAEQSERLTATTSDLDAAAASLLTFRDQPGSDPLSKTAHGNGFDRVAAFQDGVVLGVERCKEYPRGGVDYTEDVFDSFLDAASEGNAPLPAVIPAVFGALDRFWATGFAEAFDTEASYSPIEKIVRFTDTPGECPGGAVPLPSEVQELAYYCPRTDELGHSADVDLAQLYDVLGDGSVAMVLSDRWGYGMRHKAGEDLDGTEAALQVDCTNGAFFRFANQLDALSPGDLDEAIAALLASSILLDVEEDRGQGFVRVGAFRVGFNDGLAVCNDLQEPDVEDISESDPES